MFLKKSEGGLENGKCPETFEGTKKEEQKRDKKSVKTVKDERRDKWRSLEGILKNEREEGEEWRGEPMTTCDSFSSGCGFSGHRASVDLANSMETTCRCMREVLYEESREGERE